MILLIDTTKEKLGEQISQKLMEKGKNDADFELVDAGEMNISHCIGCNFCWLKTPGKCVINDDYGPIMKKMKDADQVWLITDTSLGFVSYKTKNIVDRIMPLLTMYLHIDKETKMMRHIIRYDKMADWGLIFTGDAPKDYLNKWIAKVASNSACKSLGAYEKENIEEAVSCM